MQDVIATSEFVNTFDHSVDTVRRALPFLSSTICMYAIARYFNQRHCPVSPSCVCWGAMAEAPKTEEAYVSPDFETLHGQTKRLRFARGVALGVLCCTHRSNRKTEWNESESERVRVTHTHTHKNIATGNMQQKLCVAFGKCPAIA